MSLPKTQLLKVMRHNNVNPAIQELVDIRLVLAFLKLGQVIPSDHLHALPTQPLKPARNRHGERQHQSTVVAPLAAFTMACVLFAYTRSSIQAAKLNAKIHRDAEKQNTAVRRGENDK
ncbi:hypothetical protein B0H67DRAFT_206972 [Lasiosphaeris hirsuta]|uniref:Uncharacterized protein n=1 Tax=Lasiosphaeris hirsuta TaxID=260670 RepID=A0AA40E360_9PEZI|nr:hypothetical protein B0H67DRAFT_206972 [Lasiosphaeris hirsuta]